MYNDSPASVYEVRAFYVVDYTVTWANALVAMVSTGGRNTELGVQLEFDKALVELPLPNFGITFRDNGGLRWGKYVDGALIQLLSGDIEDDLVKLTLPTDR